MAADRGAGDTPQREEIKMNPANAESSTCTFPLGREKNKTAFLIPSLSSLSTCAVIIASYIVAKNPGKDASDLLFLQPS